MNCRNNSLSRIIIILSSLALASCSTVEKPHADRQVLSMKAIGSRMEISTKTTPGHIYQLEKRQSLDNGDWTAVGEPVTATSATITIIDTNAAERSSFYRIVPLGTSSE